MKKTLIRFSILLFLVLQSCAVTLSTPHKGKHDNGKHKGWYKNTKNPHHPDHHDHHDDKKKEHHKSNEKSKPKKPAPKPAEKKGSSGKKGK